MCEMVSSEGRNAACTVTRRGSLSFYLGGKVPSDPKMWSPDMKTVRATIKYAMATGRLDAEEKQRRLDLSQIGELY
jgi:hypothetical protein